MDWGAILFSPITYNGLEQLALKRFWMNKSVSEEAFNYCLEKLTENNWHRLRNYQNKAKPQTFLYSVSTNLLEDFSRKKYGRIRKPTIVKVNGIIWSNMWDLLVTNAFKRAEIIATIRQRHNLDFAQTAEIYDKLLPKIDKYRTLGTTYNMSDLNLKDEEIRGRVGQY